MIRFALTIFIGLFIAGSAHAQLGYEPYVTESGLKISTKWGKAKDADGTKKTALMIGIVNDNPYAVTYAYTINLYYEGVLRETGRMEELCILGQKSNIGKINGVYFIPQKFTEEQLKNSDFNFTIDSIDVAQTENCKEEEPIVE
jgi:hypothetical protein